MVKCRLKINFVLQILPYFWQLKQIVNEEFQLQLQNTVKEKGNSFKLKSAWDRIKVCENCLFYCKCIQRGLKLRYHNTRT